MLLGTAMLLSAISLTEIYSSTLSLEVNFFSRQLAAVAVGLVLLFIVAATDYHSFSEHIPWIYLASLALLVYTLFFGKVVSSSRSWVFIGSKIGFQPSELIKIVVVVALARYFAEVPGQKYMTLAQTAKAILVCGIPMSLVLLQPDLGTAMTYFPALALGVFIRGVRPAVLVSLILCFILVLPISWLFLKDYQKDRITSYLHPEGDPRGRGYQVLQSKIAIGSGGFWGKGLFKGSQNRLGFLPTRHTDFIFSVVGEELGFLGVMVTLGALVFILARSVTIAQTARDSLGLFIVMGIVGIYFFHVVENVGMVIGFMPTTGIPLPFVSYGGSSVLTAFIALGLVMSVRRCRYVN